MSDVTQLLQAIETGQPAAADQLLPLVYGELRALAAARMANERPGPTLQATALVHEAWIRLVGDDERRVWNGRGHLFAAAAEAMRRILTDRARRKARIRHGGGLERIDLEHVTLATEDSDDTVLGGSYGGTGEFSGGVISSDASRMTLQGGTFGGKATWAGAIWPTGNSVLTLLGGTFGGSALYSGEVRTAGAATVTIEGGVFGSSGQESGGIVTSDTSTVTINGGTFGGTGAGAAYLLARDSAKLTINGGLFGGPGAGAGQLRVVGTTTRVKIQAASFDTAAYLPATGGALGVTFPDQSPQSLSTEIERGAIELVVITPAPELRMEQTASGLELSWGSSEADYELTSAARANGPGAWFKWPGTPVLEGDRWVVRLTVPEAAGQFFQLQPKR